MTIISLFVFFLNRSATLSEGFFYIVAGLSMDAFIIAIAAFALVSSVR
jgi:ABC-type enterobactin transport system permease subunit